VKTDREELAARLARHFPKVKPADIALAARALIREGRHAHKLAEDECNRPEKSEREFEKREMMIRSAASAVLAGLFVIQRLHGKPADPIKIEITHDPRGYCLRLHAESIGYNTWGGKDSGYGI
jgi:hypothetical protein